MNVAKTLPRRSLIFASLIIAPCVLWLASEAGLSRFNLPLLLPSTFTSTAIAGIGEPVVLSLIVYGLTTAEETGILIKSAIMYTSSPLDFHLVADAPAQEYMESLFALVTNPVYDIRVFYYPISIQAMSARLERTARPTAEFKNFGMLWTTHGAALPGMMKLFLHEILPEDVKRSLFVDSDAFFITDPTLLWREFNNWNSSHALSIPYHPAQERPLTDDWQGASRICSCVLMLDLERMRKIFFMDSSLFSPRERALSPAPEGIKRTWGVPDYGDGSYRRVGLGDQGYYWAIQDYRPDLVIPLPLHWEVTWCIMELYNVGMDGEDTMTANDQIKAQKKLEMTPWENDLLVPKLLHFNCLGDGYYTTEHFTDPSTKVNRKIGHAVRYHLHFKWIWLNRGDGTASIASATQQDLRFFDERHSGVSIAAGY